MLEAGSNKSANFGLRYYGGMTAALALDIETRRNTQLARGFPQFMRAMYQEFGITRRPYAYDDVIRIANATSGSDLTPFFTRYVAGTERIPLETYLTEAGITLVTDKSSVIRPNASASQQERALWNALKR